MKDLKKRVVQSGLAKVCSQVANSALRLGYIAVMARLLHPEDFGLVAMVVAVTSFYELFTTAGLLLAAVQRALAHGERRCRPQAKRLRSDLPIGETQVSVGAEEGLLDGRVEGSGGLLHGAVNFKIQVSLENPGSGGPAEQWQTRPARSRSWEGFLPAIFLDRNSQVGCHNLMKTGTYANSNCAQDRAQEFAYLH